MLENDEASARIKPGGQLGDGALPLVRAYVVHHVRNDDGVVVGIQLTEAGRKAPPLPQPGIHCVYARIGDVEAVHRGAGQMLPDEAGKEPDTATEVEYLSREPVRQKRRQVAGFVLGEDRPRPRRSRCCDRGFARSRRKIGRIQALNACT